MEKWLPFALIAAVFIAVRDFISQDIVNKYNYTEYVILANFLIFIGTIIYIVVNKKDISKIKKPNIKEFIVILIRLLIVYLIVEPCIFNSLKYCDNPSYAKSIINLNTLFLLILALVFYKVDFNKKKILGVMLLVGGTYFIT